MYPPYRTQKPVDVPKSIRKRLSDYRFLMNYLENHLRERNIFKINPTLEVNQMFEIAKEVLGFDQGSSKKRKRREEQVKWILW